MTRARSSKAYTSESRNTCASARGVEGRHEPRAKRREDRRIERLPVGEQLRAADTDQQEPVQEPIGDFGAIEPARELVCGDMPDDRDVRPRRRQGVVFRQAAEVA